MLKLFDNRFFKNGKIKVLSLILLFGLLKGIVFISLVPIWQAPDEPAYYQEIEVVANEHKIPGINAEKFINHPPLYYLTATPFYLVGSLWGETASFYAIRVFGILLLIGIALIGYLVAKELFSDNDFIQLMTPALILLNPQLTFINGSVNSDALLNFFFALFFWQGTLLVKRGVSMKAVIFMSLVIFGGIYTKERFLIAIYALGVLLFLLLIRFLWRTFNLSLTSLFRKIRVVDVFVFLVSAFLIFSSLDLISKEQARIIYISQDSNFGNYLFRQFWGYFGWLNIPMSIVEYELLNWLPILAVVGLVVAFLRVVSTPKYILSKDNKAFSITVENKKNLISPDHLITYIYFASSIILSMLAISQYELYGAGSQGRYLFVIIIPYFIFISLGLSNLATPDNNKRLFAFIFIGLFIINFIALFNYIVPFYY